MITIFAPDGIGEVTPDTDLAAVVADAVAADDAGPLRDGDIVVITSKVVSKHEGCVAPAEDKPAVLVAETARTVARRGRFAIVETRHGLVQAAAGIDNSNVEAGTILTLPRDPDASADVLRHRLGELTGARVGVIVSDTAGRVWRLGQTDHAIGISGVRPALSYSGQVDAYGNELHVTSMAVADELTGAADLVKAKLRDRPVAVIRGLPELLTDEPARTRDLLRPVAEDLFRLGTREAVIEAVAVALGRGEQAEELFTLDRDELICRLTRGLDPARGQLVVAMLLHACPPPIST